MNIIPSLNFYFIRFYFIFCFLQALLSIYLSFYWRVSFLLLFIKMESVSLHISIFINHAASRTISSAVVHSFSLNRPDLSFYLHIRSSAESIDTDDSSILMLRLGMYQWFHLAVSV